MKKLTVVFAVAVLAFLSGGHLMPIVHGQSGFSNANLAGTYAFSFIGTDGDQIQFSVTTLQQGNILSPCTVTGQVECYGFFNNPNTGVTTGYGPNYVNNTLTLPTLRPLSLAGQFVADGAGNITSGSGFAFRQHLTSTPGTANFSVVDESCNFNLTGTYSISASGTGSMTLNPNGCPNAAHPATLTLLVGTSDNKRSASESGIAYSAVEPNPGSFATFLNGTFVLQQ